MVLFAEDFEQEKEQKQEKQECLERQASVEKQHVYNDAFIQQMKYYEQFGETESTINSIKLITMDINREYFTKIIYFEVCNFVRLKIKLKCIFWKKVP